ncbi:MAG: MMPL family transporter [Propionibacteriaceae bacterium]|jgi:RND superfamily putative drug exporter|nr:MMPL family transporter [Propionibacteriaceae bacterium]
MFDALGRSVARHPWRAIAVWVVVLIVACGGAFWGYGHGGLFDRLHTPVSLVQGTESDEVNNLASTDAGGVGITLVVTGLDIPDDIPDLVTFLADHREDLKVDNVATIVDPFQLPDLNMPQAQALFSDKEDGFIISITLDKDLSTDGIKDTEAAVDEAVDFFEQDLRKDFPTAQVHLMSKTSLSNSIMEQVKTDLIRGEALGLPVALLLLIIIFGGFLAAGLPILGALVAIGIGMGSLWGMTFFTEVESFTINIASIIGLALSVDYGLLIVSRYREELARILAERNYGTSPETMPDKPTSTAIVREAMEITLKTAGRTVFFSAVTIACALSALLIMKAQMLRIIAASGMIVTLLAVLTAMTLVPSVIVLMRRTMIKPSMITRIPVLKSLVKAVGDSSSDHGFFSRLARGVHKRPWIILGVVTLILVAMASPLKDLQVRSAFSDFIPEESPSSKAYYIIQEDYPGLVDPSIIIVADVPPEDTADLVSHVERITDVAFVSQPSPLADDDQRTKITVRIDVANQVGTQVTQEVKDLRTHDPGYPIHVGGSAAIQLDFIQSIIDRTPGAFAIMGFAVFFLMFLMTGSIIVPIKAILINGLSLLASLGLATFIFINGYLGMPQVQGMETFIIVCFICFGFGLAMDYEVFLIARIKEFYNQGLPNDEAVERGLQRSGRIITSAAAIIVAVFIGFSFGGMIAIKQIGVVLAITIITDATLVRMLLVPATMTILGKWNWWAPKPLKWIYDRLHIVH